MQRVTCGVCYLSIPCRSCATHASPFLPHGVVEQPEVSEEEPPEPKERQHEREEDLTAARQAKKKNANTTGRTDSAIKNIGSRGAEREKRSGDRRDIDHARDEQIFIFTKRYVRK